MQGVTSGKKLSSEQTLAKNLISICIMQWVQDGTYGKNYDEIYEKIIMKK